jgi:hypothetical protein
LFDDCRIIKLAVTGDRQVVYSEINAQNNLLRSVVLLSGSNLFGEREQEETPAFLVNTQHAFFQGPSEVISIAFRNLNIKLLPAIQQSQDQNVAFEVGTAWEVIPYACLSDGRLCLGSLDHPASLTQTSNSNLGWEIESITDSMVYGIMEFEVLSNLMRPSIIHTELQCLSIGFDSSNNLLSGVNPNFCSNYASHIKCMGTNVYKPFGNEETKGFIPALKYGVSALTIL